MSRVAATVRRLAVAFGIINDPANAQCMFLWESGECITNKRTNAASFLGVSMIVMKGTIINNRNY